jgi:hypothetical protein
MVIVPSEELPPEIPETNQLTSGLVTPETTALNCCDCRTSRLVFTGEIDTETDGRVIDTAALADADVSALLCAVTVTEVAGADGGAVNMPELEMVPAVEFPPRMPLTSQFTAVSLVPETVAANCCDSPACTTALLGVIDTVAKLFTC